MLAAGLIECGLQPGDRIGIASPNYSRWVISMMAAARAGLILVSFIENLHVLIYSIVYSYLYLH